MLKFSPRTVYLLIRETFKGFFEDNAIYYSAALSYYTIFSLPPIIIIIISLAGAMLGKETISEEIYQQFNEMLGRESTDQIRAMVVAATRHKDTTLAKTIGFITLFVTATGVFAAIQSSLNTIWNVKTKPKNNLVKLIKTRILSFAVIISMAFLLLVSLIVHAILMAGIRLFNQLIEKDMIVLIYFINIIIPLGVVILLFAFIFKFLPDVRMQWKDVWIGAIVTGILFTVGKLLIGFYFSASDIGSAYGAAGTILLILTWVFFSSILLFLGAEFTQVYARMRGATLEPEDFAVHVERKTIETDTDKNPVKPDNKK